MDVQRWGLERESGACLELVRFVVPGDPVSKARARVTGKRAYTPEATRQAELLVGWHARQAGLRGVSDATSSFGLLCVFFTKDWRRRDADNMLKLVGDALNKIAYHDDSQLTEIAGRIVHADPEPRTHVVLYRTQPQRHR